MPAKYVCSDVDTNWALEYMQMPIKRIPQWFIDMYNIQYKTKYGFVYMVIRKGMYGLPQAGILANQFLKKY